MTNETRVTQRVTQMEAENVLLKHALSEIRDSIPSNNLNLRCYNTLGNCPSEIVEGIVRPFSNEGESNAESV